MLFRSCRSIALVCFLAGTVAGLDDRRVKVEATEDGKGLAMKFGGATLTVSA